MKALVTGGRGLAPGLTSAPVRYVTTNLLFDNGKAQRLLRWKPEYTMPRGVEEMV
jgi:nucleoside-diphosphate-sugar epimerase